MVADYALSLIYDSTTVLIDKQKKLGGIDATRFREDFLVACGTVGCFDRRPSALPK